MLAIGAVRRQYSGFHARSAGIRRNPRKSVENNPIEISHLIDPPGTLLSKGGDDRPTQGRTTMSTMTGSESSMAASLAQPSSVAGAESLPRLSPLERFFGLFTALRPQEGKALALFFVYALLLLICYYILKTIREPLLLDGGSAGAQELRVCGRRLDYSRASAGVRRAVPQDRAPPAGPLDHAVLRREPRGVLRRRTRGCGYRLRLLRLGRRVQRHDPRAVLGPCRPYVQRGKRSAPLPGDHGRSGVGRADRPDAGAHAVRGARRVESHAARDGAAGRDVAARGANIECGAGSLAQHWSAGATVAARARRLRPRDARPLPAYCSPCSRCC